MATSVDLKIGQSVPVSAYITDGYSPAVANSVVWQSSNTSICVVDNVSFTSGTNNTISTTILHALSNGSCIITCSCNGTITNTIDVIVNSPIPSQINFVVGTPTP